MKSEELFEIIGEIDEKHINIGKTKHRKSVWKKWTAAAACICIAVASLVAVRLQIPSGNIEDGHDNTDNQIISGETRKSTSDKYDNLEELLAYLSKNDNHNSAYDSNGGRSMNSNVDYVQEGATAVAYDGYIYYLGEKCVKITSIDGENECSEINYTASELFICGDRLVLVGNNAYRSEIELEYYTYVRIFSLEVPEKPILQDVFVQGGELAECHMSGDKLYIMTTDGVCACGWSRLDDISGYVPSLSVNETDEIWTYDDISILGEPTSVNYLAVSTIDIDTGNILEKQAFYGDIENVFFGEKQLAVVTQSRTEMMFIQPEIYVFDDNLSFTGKIDMAEVTDTEKNIEIADGALSDGVYVYVKAVLETDNEIGVIGEYLHKNGENSERQMLIASGKPETGSGSFKLIGGYDNLGIDDIYFEENNAIICVSVMNENMEMSTEFITAKFNESDFSVYSAEFTADEVSGVENYYWLGSPYGSLETLIPIGEGIFLRYNGTPDGFDIFDFSDAASPKLIYRSDGEIPYDERFEFTWKVLDKNVFGVMHMKMGEGEDIRNTIFSWRIYSVDVESDRPFTLLKEYVFGDTGFLASSLQFSIAEYENEFYGITADSEKAVKFEW